MEKIITIEAFIKAVDKEFFDTFLNEGEICMNTLKTFQKFESKNKAISDKYEGAIFAIGKGSTISIAPIGKYDQFETLATNVEDVLFFNEEYNGNILSLYSITDDHNIHVIPKEFIKGFDNHRFCLITAPGLFLEKLHKEIEKRGFTQTTKVAYYFVPDNNLKKLDPFQKRDKYAYQRETRVYFSDINAELQLFKIGSIREFAFEIFPMEYMYKISNKDGRDLIITTENS